MAHPILMPKPGQMTEECTIVAWHKDVGETVRRGDVLFEIETDKSNMDVEAFDDGVLLRRYVEVGQTVPVNSVCAYVGEPGELVPDEAPSVLAADREPEPEPARLPVAAVGAVASVAAVAAVAAGEAPGFTAARSVAPGAPPANESAERAGRLRISPRASRLAAGAGIDPRAVRGSGPDGRITERDVRAAIDVAGAATPAAVAGAATPPRATGTTATAPTTPPETEASDGEPRPLSRMRRVIAERLTLSATTIPHFTVTVAVDMSRLVALRTELKAAGTTLSLTDFILSAAAQTLVEFPDVNSRTDGVTVWPRRRVHLGMAVSIPNGLVVPVIRDADRRSLAELHDSAAALADAARNGSLTPDDMSGGTFTVSNLGMLGVEEFSAIINPGEAAILAVSSVVPSAVAVGEGIGIRQMMKLTLSADHRLVDGELAARFLNAIRRRLEDATAYRNELVSA